MAGTGRVQRAWRRRPWIVAGAATALLLPPAALQVDRALATTQPPPLTPVPDLACDSAWAGHVPETESTQGRTPLADFVSGRSDLGYKCNADAVGQWGNTGGFRVYRYVDRAGHVCAFFDSSQLFPTSINSETHKLGVYVLDMSNPAAPLLTDNLTTPAMDSPHESLSLNVGRGLLAADMGNPATYPGFVDIYDVSNDCRTPTLDVSLPIGVIGHEGTFSPDGNTFWVTSVAGNLTALDVSNPKVPTVLYSNLQLKPHGLNVSDDGNTLYMADLGTTPAGLTILDVSQIQGRRTLPAAPQISHLTWDSVSTPQVPIPITVHGHPYVVEMDEFDSDASAANFQRIATYEASSTVGAARIIDIEDPADPTVVSNIRLAVNQPDARAGAQQSDPGASTNIGGYAGHYCAVPQRDDPGILACSFIMSGLRVFDIHNPAHPVEIAYFNMPPKTTPGSSSYSGSDNLSQPAFDVANHQIWFADGNTGFWDVQIDPAVWDAAVGGPPAPTLSGR